MKKKLYLLTFLILAFTACVSTLYPRLKDIQTINVVYGTETKANWGSLVPVNFIGKLKDGSAVSMNKWIHFKDSFISFYPKSIKLHLDFNPNHYKEDSFCIIYKYKLSENWDSFWLKPTFDAPLYFNYNGANGITPQFQKRNLLGILLQGRDGRSGLNGTEGQKGRDLVVRIEKDSASNLYNIYVVNLETDEMKYYATIEPVPIIISSN